ncbi:MAG TPA: hypothetical protein PKC65_12445 [Pyrinomonadaceae bacterium]|mgnify:FL=1|nr:hypothetical protein [Pyrinomonadaceae bacterium]
MSDENKTTEAQQIQSVPIAFAPDELTRCENCGRDNAPNRSSCIYCGAEIAIRDEFLSHAKVVANDLAPDEAGWNIIARACAIGDSRSHKELESLNFHVSDAPGLRGSNALIPIARFSSEQTAQVAQKRLTAFETAIVGDDRFEVEKPATRISKLELDGESLLFTDFNRGSSVRWPVTDVSAVVLGTIRVSRTTTYEKRSIRKKSTITDEISDARDSPLLDIYVNGDRIPFSVHSTGFDFSILAGDRSLLASENFTRLADKIRVIAPQAKIVTEFDAVRMLLSGPWPEASRADGLGRVQTGIGQRRYGRIATIDNTLQFTKFSRLQALKLNEPKR